MQHPRHRPQIRPLPDWGYESSLLTAQGWDDPFRKLRSSRREISSGESPTWGATFVRWQAPCVHLYCFRHKAARQVCQNSATSEGCKPDTLHPDRRNLMAIAPHWRLKAQRYRLEGSTCLICGQLTFPPRPVCPHGAAQPARNAGGGLSALPTSNRTLDTVSSRG
jgi:hypothetical protein